MPDTILIGQDLHYDPIELLLTLVSTMHIIASPSLQSKVKRELACLKKQTPEGIASRRNTRRIPSGDYGQHSVDVAGMLAPPIRLQYSHNYYVYPCVRETWQIENRMVLSEKPIDDAVATATRPSYKVKTLADL